MQTDLSDFEDFDVENFDFFPPPENLQGHTGSIPRIDPEDFLEGEFELPDYTVARLEPPDPEPDEPRVALKPPEYINEPVSVYEPPNTGFEAPYSGLPSEDSLFLPEYPEFDDPPIADLVDDPTSSISNDPLVFGSDSEDSLFLPEYPEIDDPPFTVPVDKPTLLDTSDLDSVFNPIDITSDDVSTSENDFIIGSTTSDDRDGLGGNDVIYGLGGNDSLTGGTGNDFLRGGTGSDTLVGDAGDDRLIGTSLTDLYAGRGEYDSLSGGIGADVFVIGDRNRAYYTGDGYATIEDFSVLEGDSIQLTGSIDEYLREGNNQGGTNIYRGSDLIAVVDDTDAIPSENLDFV